MHFDYIGLGRAARSDDNGALVSGFGYDAFGRLASTTLTGQPGLIAKSTWDAPLDGIPRVATQTDQFGARRYSAYQVDQGGRFASEVHGVLGYAEAGFSATSSTSEANNAVDALINAGPNRRLQLDGRGNWRSRASSDASTSASPVRTALDRYSSFDQFTNGYDGDKLTLINGPNGAQYQYDGFGQLISAVETNQATNGVTYTYDALGRVSSRSTPNSGLELYGYDGSERVVRTGSGGASITIDGDGQDEHLVRIANGRFERIHQIVWARFSS